MRRFPLALAVLLAACAAPSGGPAPAPGSLRIAIFGDMPYTTMTAPEREVKLTAYRAVLDSIAKERVAFVVHIGDITGAVCGDSMVAQRVREFAALPHPLFYTFGDNEWTDCARDGMQPLERLANLRRLFAQGGESLGARRLPLQRQSADFPENTRWRAGGVVFLTLHVVGSNNNWGPGPAPSEEFVSRNAADLAWLREGFDAARREGARGVAVFMQANPWTAGTGSRPALPAQPGGFNDLVAEIQRQAIDFGRPVALVHGDTHYFRIDQPLLDPRTGRILTNLTRVETYGDPNHSGVIMTVDPRRPNLFAFEPLVVQR
jgi:hypothetical protein